MLNPCERVYQCVCVCASVLWTKANHALVGPLYLDRSFETRPRKTFAVWPSKSGSASKDYFHSSPYSFIGLCDLTTLMERLQCPKSRLIFLLFLQGLGHILDGPFHFCERVYIDLHCERHKPQVMLPSLAGLVNSSPTDLLYLCVFASCVEGLVRISLIGFGFFQSKNVSPAKKLPAIAPSMSYAEIAWTPSHAQSLGLGSLNADAISGCTHFDPFKPTFKKTLWNPFGITFPNFNTGHIQDVHFKNNMKKTVENEKVAFDQQKKIIN